MAAFPMSTAVAVLFLLIFSACERAAPAAPKDETPAAVSRELGYLRAQKLSERLSLMHPDAQPTEEAEKAWQDVRLALESAAMANQAMRELRDELAAAVSGTTPDMSKVHEIMEQMRELEAADPLLAKLRENERSAEREYRRSAYLHDAEALRIYDEISVIEQKMLELARREMNPPTSSRSPRTTLPAEYQADKERLIAAHREYLAERQGEKNSWGRDFEDLSIEEQIELIESLRGGDGVIDTANLLESAREIERESEELRIRSMLTSTAGSLERYRRLKGQYPTAEQFAREGSGSGLNSCGATWRSFEIRCELSREGYEIKAVPAAGAAADEILAIRTGRQPSWVPGE